MGYELNIIKLIKKVRFSYGLLKALVTKHDMKMIKF